MVTGLAEIGKIGGTPVRIHWSTFLLPIGVFAFALYNDVSTKGIIWLECFVLITLICVLFHELGHAFAAKAFSTPVHDIILLPIGGAARLERLPRSPWQEALVALSGPLVNLLIAFLFLPAVFIYPEHEWFPWLDNYTLISGAVCLAFFNVAICLFNLLPVFPLDGGRLLRAALSGKYSRLTATRVTAFVARIIAIVGLGYAVFEGSFFLGGFAIYVFLIAGREIRIAKVQAFFDSHSVGEIALPIRVFRPSELNKDVLHQLQRNNQKGAVIADECSPVGFVTVDLLLQSEAEDHVGSIDMQVVVCHDSHTSLRVLRGQFAEHPNSVAIEEIGCRPAGYIDLPLFEHSFQTYAKTA